jgi:hypothetical protein
MLRKIESATKTQDLENNLVPLSAADIGRELGHL